jgi:hypothetical protein
MSTIQTSTIIHRPVEQVFEFTYNPQKRRLWQPEAVELIEDNAGDSRDHTHKKVSGWAGLKLDVIDETKEFVPNQRHVTHTRETHGRFTVQSRWDFEVVPDGTRVVIHHEVMLNGWMKLASPILMLAARRKVDGDLARLKTALEG